MIFISAGHHPTKPGACFEDFCEFDEAAKWATMIQEQIGDERSMLVPFGVLRDKVGFINARVNGSISLAVEIHFNSAVVNGEHVGRGSETLYYPNSHKGKLAAEIVQDNLSNIFEPNRGAKEGYYRMNKKYGPDYFLAKTKCTALIIEPEFIDNKSTIINGREKGCLSIANALLEIIND